MVADLIPAWLARYNAKHGTSWQGSDLTQWEIWKDLGCTKNEIFSLLTPDIYDSEVVPIYGSFDAVRALRRMGHEIVFLSSCYTPEAADAKLEWLYEYGFGSELIPVGPWATYKHKRDFNSHWLVDDYVGNIEGRVGGVLMNRPHNRRALWYGRRVQGLPEFANIIWEQAAA